MVAAGHGVLVAPLGLEPSRLGAALPGPRAWLRARPRLQGLVVAPSGAHLRLPHDRGALFVLLYHEVSEKQAAGLRRQVTALLDRGPFLSWDESLRALTDDTPLKGPHFCLTFDDGHKEWRDRVLPFLDEHNLKASFFITTDKVAAGRSRSRLTWGDCARLVDAGMHIGSHSISHRRLRPLTDADAWREIAESKDLLEQQLGVAVQDFSAPYGLPQLDYADRELDLVKAAGYRSFASALPGGMQPGHPVFALRRCGLSPSWPLVAMKRRVHE